MLLVVVSGSLSVASPPAVQACNACNFLLTWGSFGTGNGNFSNPRGVAVDSAGHVWVVDSNSDRVEKFTGTGGYLSQIGCPAGACSSGSGPGQFNVPWVVAVDSAGNVYVTDYYNNRVEEFTTAGAYITAWGCATAGTGCTAGFGPGEFNVPFGIAVDSARNVYVTDLGNNRVEKFTTAGTYITAWGCTNAATQACTAGSGPGQFNVPRGVAVDSAGNVYVADAGNSRVEKFTGTGAFITAWGSSGTGNGNFSSPRGVAVDSAGNVYVADGNNNRVQKFTSVGTYISQLGCASGACSSGTGNGQFISPYGVAIDSSGNLYVVDGGNNRVELFGDSTLPVPEFSGVAVVTFWALGASLYLLRRKRR